jgi:DhnA-type fructose-1,6-bisphosphate aldolase and related enzymes
MLAVDHGYFLGPTEKLEEPNKVVAPLLKYCDSLMVTRGVQEHLYLQLLILQWY